MKKKTTVGAAGAGGKKNEIGRRQFLSQTMALGAMGLAGMWGGGGALMAKALPPAKTALQSLPARGTFILKNGFLLTMDPALGEVPEGDVLVREGRIEGVGKNLTAGKATVLDARGMIVLPGLVDTHWHMWTSLMRSLAGEKEGTGYFDKREQYGTLFRPDDMYQGNRLGAAEAIFSGITTVHDWCHNVRSFEHATACLRALTETGIRARFSVGPATGQEADQPIDLAVLEKLHQNWRSYRHEGLLSLGMAWRGIGQNKALGLKELERARQLNLPVSVHTRGEGEIRQLAEAGALGPHLQIVHGMEASPSEVAQMVKAGTSISISPYSELRIGYGIPPIPAFLKGGATIGLSVDTTTLSGNADMFGIMKIFLNLANALNKDEFSLTARRVLELATIDGARSLGLADHIGSLTPGKRADIILLSPQAFNMGYLTNPADLVVEAAQPANVDTVIIDGRILKRQGKMTALAQEQVLKEAAGAFASLEKRVKK